MVEGPDAPCTGTAEDDVGGLPKARRCKELVHDGLQDQVPTHLHAEQHWVRLRTLAKPCVPAAVRYPDLREVGKGVQVRQACRTQPFRRLVWVQVLRGPPVREPALEAVKGCDAQAASLEENHPLLRILLPYVVPGWGVVQALRTPLLRQGLREQPQPQLCRYAGKSQEEAAGQQKRQAHRHAAQARGACVHPRYGSSGL
mmetsp:Transcript_88419/g.245484  ORF Transcript_88419/g.245484 Transcript_88419/m.245484 type:complete len:200 (-) Transcript_88419:12-611(-)